MAIDTIKRVSPVCDKCGYKLPILWPATVAGFDEMYRMLGSAGWKIHRIYKPEKKAFLYCPKCKRKNDETR